MSTTYWRSNSTVSADMVNTDGSAHKILEDHIRYSLSRCNVIVATGKMPGLSDKCITIHTANDWPFLQPQWKELDGLRLTMGQIQNLLVHHIASEDFDGERVLGIGARGANITFKRYAVTDGVAGRRIEYSVEVEDETAQGCGRVVGTRLTYAYQQCLESLKEGSASTPSALD